MEDAPESLRTAAMVQIISGVAIPVFGSTVGTCVIGMIAGLLTFWAGGIGAFCGYCGFCSFFSALLVPVGIIEIIAGIITMSNPRQGAPFSRIVGFVEVVAVLLGGLTTAIAGVVVLMAHRKPEVAAWLESGPR